MISNPSYVTLHNTTVMLNIPDGRTKQNHLSYWARQDRLAGKGPKQDSAKKEKQDGGVDDHRGLSLEEKKAKKKADKAKGADKAKAGAKEVRTLHTPHNETHILRKNYPHWASNSTQHAISCTVIARIDLQH